jgi:hypothetical protein
VENDEEQDDEEACGSEEESEVDKENECPSVHEVNDDDVVEDEPSHPRTEGLTLISTNTVPIQETSESVNPREKRNYQVVCSQLSSIVGEKTEELVHRAAEPGESKAGFEHRLRFSERTREGCRSIGVNSFSN